MYIINNITDGETYCLHDQRDRSLRVLEPRLILTLNRTGQLDFRITPDHMYYHTIRKLKSIIRVIEDGELIYEGRPMFAETDFNNVVTYTCEGSMAYLIDSIQRPFSITGSIHDFFSEMLKRHNEQVEERKQFVMGRVNVADENNERKRESTGMENTRNTMDSQLVAVHGGCIWVEYRDGKKYLNYTYDHGGKNEQEIRFGVNLLDLTKHQDATDVVTCLCPYGGEEEYHDELGDIQTRMIDITSVNDGKDYIMAEQSALDEYGKIWGTCQWPDITDPSRLLEKARTYLKELPVIPDSLEISAVDLNYTGMDIRRFRVGYHTAVVSKPHGVRKELLLTKLDLYLDDPAKGRICLGTAAESFTASTVSQQVNISRTVKQSEERLGRDITRKIENATQLITGGKGGYVVLDVTDPDTGEKTHPWRILIMNTPDKETATNVIQINQNGIGFSTTGINGPYSNAWTIDGNLVADFITAGTMLADRIRGGTLEVGGKGLGKDGEIKVMDADGNMIGTWTNAGLIIKKGSLEGTSINVGVFNADINGVEIGGFQSMVDWGRDIFQSFDGKTGLSAEYYDSGSLWIWAGWNDDNDFDFAVNNNGTCLAREFRITERQDFWKGWNITDTMEDVYNRLSNMQDQIDSIDAGGEL